MIFKDLNCQEIWNCRQPRKMRQRQGVQRQRSEAYLRVCRNDGGCSATQHMDILRGRHDI